MAGLLAETLRRWASSPCEPLPCGLEVWRYCCEARGVPVAELPWHQSKMAAARMLKDAGGIVPFAAGLVEPLGWRLEGAGGLEELQAGDVGILTIPNMGDTCALFAGQRWAVKGDRNVLMVQAVITPLAAWRLPECLKL